MLKIKDIRAGLTASGYIPNEEICYAVFQALVLNKPILIEGDPGVGKTSLAKAVAKMLDLPFLRLQMYDGLTKEDVLYDYDYQRQLLTLEAIKPKIETETNGMDANAAIKKVASEINFYGKEFLIPRPVLQTINGSGKKLLLIDEIDKASEETEYMLYEYLEEYGMNIPQYGSIQCPDDQTPIVFLTSNGYRELSGAMRRRCGYLYIQKKTRNEIIEILKHKAGVNEHVAGGIATCIVKLQERDLKHPISISEAVDWANYLKEDVTKERVLSSIGLLAKDRRDLSTVKSVLAQYSSDICS